MDRVSTYNDKLSFLIPHEWVEAFEDDTYLYCHPETESGWFRVSLLTVRTGDEAPSQRLEKFFDGKEDVTVDHQSGNLVSASEKDSEEGGSRVHHYYWMVANVVSPDLVREAIFSYTVLQDRVNDDDTKQMVSLIGKLVSQADFSPSE